MWFQKLLITFAAIAAISSQISAQVQNQNSGENQKIDTIQKIRPHDEENVTEFLSNDFNMTYSSQMSFEIVLANSMKNFLPFSHVNKNCVSDGLQYKIGLKNQTRWAVQMYESSAKYPSSDMELGNFDECMSASSDSLEIRGAYALARMQFYRVDDDVMSQFSGPIGQDQSRAIKVAADVLVKTLDNSTIPMPVRSLDLLWALCFPDSCTNEDVEISVRHALTPDLMTRYTVAIDVAVPSSTYTSRRATMPVTNAVLLVNGIFVLGLVLVAIGTLYDWLKRPENNTFFDSSVRAFSLMRNLRNLTADSKDDEFAIANGLKTIGLVTVIMGHRIALDLGTPSFNPEYSKNFSASVWLSFMKTTVSLEIFFVLSGFFMFIMIEKRLRNGKPLKFFHALIYRLARILPTYMTVIVIYAYLLPYMGDGPLWKLINYTEAEYCRKNWWTNLLFVNNYVNSEESCIMPAWYLASDIHFFIIGTILTYIIWRWKTIGIGIFSIVFAASIYIPAKYIYDNERWGLVEFSYSNLKNIRAAENFKEVHIKSHNRITTYFIGFISSIFECKMVVVLSRISYVVYLVHSIVQLQDVGQVRQPMFKNFWSLYWKINTDLIISLSYSLPINFIVEAPSRQIFQHIMDIFTKNERGKLDSKVNQLTENGMSEKSNVAVPMHNIGVLNPTMDVIPLEI